MGVKRLNYLSIPVGRRRILAKNARRQIKEAMFQNPGLSADDAAKYQERLDKLDKWEGGTLEVSEQPSEHMVKVSETVTVEES